MKDIFIITATMLTAFFVIYLPPAKALDGVKTPIVLELFTSQSCSSCPPADKILGMLAMENDNIIALSCHVTYWNHLHWKDNLSHQLCTDRQRQYVQTLRSRGSYTPQIVINGQETMVGSKERKIRNTITSANAIKPIGLSIENNQLTIKLPETPGNDSYAINLVIYNNTHQQHIPSGENKGRTVNYTNPIQNITSLGTWDGTGKTMTHDLAGYSNYKGFAVLAQTNSPTGAILAAGKISP